MEWSLQPRTLYDFVMFKLSKPPSDPLGPLVAQHPPRTPHGRVAPDRHSWPEAGKSEGLDRRSRHEVTGH